MSYDVFGGLMAAPVVALAVYLVIRNASRHESDQFLRRVVMLGVVLKLLGGLARYFVAADVYGGSADAFTYHDHGARIARNFWSLNFDTGLDTVAGTDFIRLLTGIVYTVVGPSAIGGFLVFSVFGFLGLYLWFRAFRMAVPDSSARWYAVLVFLAPSLLFWPSSIGKESWMTFVGGLAAYGVARVLSSQFSSGLTWLALGVLGAGVVRPHIAALVALSAAFAYVLKPSERQAKTLGPVAKVLGLAGLAVVVYVASNEAKTFFALEDVSYASVVELLERTQMQTSQGGSQFGAPAPVLSLLSIPISLGTVLLRPLATEAHNTQALIAAIEAAAIGVLLVVRARSLLAALASLRRTPFVAFCVCYTIAFSMAFSSIANFGILARQRVQMLPAVFALFAVQPRGVKAKQTRSRDQLIHV